MRVANVQARINAKGLEQAFQQKGKILNIMMGMRILDRVNFYVYLQTQQRQVFFFAKRLVLLYKLV